MFEKVDPVFLISLVRYLEHVCVVVMAVLHHHCLVTGQSERDAVLSPAVNSLQQQQQQAELKLSSYGKGFHLRNSSYIRLNHTVTQELMKMELHE